MARTTIDPSERRGATRRRHATSGEPTPPSERQRQLNLGAHGRTTVTLSKTTLVFHHELRSKRRALPERPSRHKWRERRPTRASAVERHVVDMQRVVSRRRSCERQRRRDRHAHARTTVTLSKTTLVFHHELRSKRRALPKRPSRHKWRERRSTRASAVERHVVDMQRVATRRRSCKRQRRRDRHAHERTTVTSVENDTRFSITSCGRDDERSPSDRRGARGANDDRPEGAPWSDTSSTCNEW